MRAQIAAPMAAIIAMTAMPAPIREQAEQPLRRCRAFRVLRGFGLRHLQPIALSRLLCGMDPAFVLLSLVALGANGCGYRADQPLDATPSENQGRP